MFSVLLTELGVGKDNEVRGDEEAADVVEYQSRVNL